ncbi:histone H2B-like [Tiliqua scincoides]|uniref:histone H2B-like n=1 Tax=Tiliqua scincoides TaxID=71010 RepID=UPI0034633776
MAAASGKKRKTPLRKSWKVKSKRSQPVKKHHFKTKKQARAKPAMKYGKTIQLKPARLPLDDSKTLRQLKRNRTLMTDKAKMIMISFVKKLYKWVSVEAERLRRERKRSSIGFTEMRTALKSVMPVKCNKCKESASRSGGAGYMKAS